jgi:hypothetical protein
MIPIGAISNIPKGRRFSSLAILLIIILPEVPISVQRPPNIEANDRGIKIFDALIFAFAQAFSTMGIKTATTGVLLIKAEKLPAKSIRIKIPFVLFLTSKSES